MNWKSCLNPKVLGGLAAVAVGLFVFAPQFALSLLPILLLAACPLSMILMPALMGKQMGGNSAAAPGQYTCPMHPQVTSATPGQCPNCGMNLVQVPGAVQPQPAQIGAAGAALTREDRLAQLKAQLDQVQEQQRALGREIAEMDGVEKARENGRRRSRRVGLSETRGDGERR